MEKPDYGNWVSMRIIYVPGIAGLVFLALAFVFSPLIIIAMLLLLVSAYFAYARYLFSPVGGNVQDQVRGLILSKFDWSGKGRVLDIGCGSAALTIALAKKYNQAEIVGIDYWGEQWEYSKKICEKNAEIEKVGKQVTFQKASASLLPFNDNSFDAAISNLVFHEVRGTKDKKELIREALRVVKEGGKFAFQDLFLWKKIYGDTDELVAAIQSWGIKKVAFATTSDAAFIPTVLKLPFMVGTIGIIYGEK
jgi:ubiquinone/menaquinone biosynthesis C-methylase UbiE